MDHQSMSMSMAMSSAYSMPTSTAMSMPMNAGQNMQMTFFTSHTTPLWFIRWTPTNRADYALTCLFLILLAALFRLLFAFRTVQLNRWHSADLKRGPILVDGREVNPPKQDEQTVLLSKEGGREEVVVIKKRTRATPHWRISRDAPMAVGDTIIAAVGYLLMLAVMTFNVGYFCSVLGGTFLGSLFVGRITTMGMGH